MIINMNNKILFILIFSGLSLCVPMLITTITNEEDWTSIIMAVCGGSLVAIFGSILILKTEKAREGINHNS